MLACHLQIHADSDPAYNFDANPTLQFDADPDTLRFCNAAEYSRLSATLLDSISTSDQKVTGQKTEGNLRG
jgi:hypothetical protein